MIVVLSGANKDETVESLIRNFTISGTGTRRNKYTTDKVLTVPQMNNPTYIVDWPAETRFDHLEDLDLPRCNNFVLFHIYAIHTKSVIVSDITKKPVPFPYWEGDGLPRDV